MRQSSALLLLGLLPPLLLSLEQVGEEGRGAAGVEGQCEGGECGSDETPLLQVQPKQALSSDYDAPGTFSAYVVPIKKPGDKFPGARGRARKTASFSGGGCRALSVVLGAWRALHELGLAGAVEAVASVSGGSWGNSQYMFGKYFKATGTPLSNTDLLGAPTRPEQLSMQFLANKSSTIGASATISTDQLLVAYLAKNKAHCDIVAMLNGNVTECQLEASTKAWIDVYGTAMLGMYGLDGDIYMAASDAQVKSIKDRNPGLRFAPFATPRTDRPKSYVIVGTVDAPVGYMGEAKNLVPLQVSADFTGSPYYPDGGKVTYSKALGSQSNERVGEVIVGGGMVETFAFGGGVAPDPQNGGAGGPKKFNVGAPKAPFRLADAIGISSQAGGTAMSKDQNLQALNPVFPYWAVTPSAKDHQQAQLYTFSDGGCLDNLGIIPMLQSGATRLVVFFAASGPITSSVDLCKVPASYNFTEAASTDLSSLFGYMPRNTAAYVYEHNQVFDSKDYQPLLCALQTLRHEGKPAVHRSTVTVVKNDWWGVTGGNRVDVLWYYLDKVKNFEDKLPGDTKWQLAQKEKGAFANFPTYQTTFQNPPELTMYTAQQVNLLAAQVEYSVRENRDLYKAFLMS